MRFFFNKVLPLVVGFTLWQVLPGVTSKVIVGGGAVTYLAFLYVRHRRDTRRRITALLLVFALLGATTLPAAAQRGEQGTVQVQQAGCGLKCFFALAIAGGMFYDGFKWVFFFWLEGLNHKTMGSPGEGPNYAPGRKPVPCVATVRRPACPAGPGARYFPPR